MGKSILDSLMSGLGEFGEMLVQAGDVIGLDGSFGMDANYETKEGGLGKKDYNSGNSVTINNYITGDLDANEQRKNIEQMSAAMMGL